MKVRFHQTFDRQFAKLSKAKQDRAKGAILQWMVDPNQPSLRNHPLKGGWDKYHSISAGGDLRLHYRVLDADTALFVAVGTHAQLYK